jgi:hypothetical protein
LGEIRIPLGCGRTQGKAEMRLAAIPEISSGGELNGWMRVFL